MSTYQRNVNQTVTPSNPMEVVLPERHAVTLNASQLVSSLTINRYTMAGAFVETKTFSSGQAVYGPFAGTNVLSITCAAGSADVTVVEAVLGAAQVSVYPLARPANSLIAIGDSFLERTYYLHTISTASRTAGVTTLTLNLNGMALNTPIAVYGLPADMEGEFTVSATSGFTISYVNPGPNVAAATLGSYPLLQNRTRYMDHSMLTWAQILSNQKLDLLGICAHTGRTTADMLAHMGEVTGKGAGYALVCGGANNILQGISNTQTIAELTQIYANLRATGHEIIAIPVPPLAAPAWTAAFAAKQIELNAWIVAKAIATPGMRLADINRVMTDPLNASKGIAKAGYLISDGIHKSWLGGQTAGGVIAAAIADIPYADFRTRNNGDNYGTTALSKNLYDFAPWTNGGGTVTPDANASGVLGAGFTGTLTGAGTIVYSAPARSDGLGYDNTAVLTPTGSLTSTIVSTAAWTSRLVAGDSVQMDKTVSVSGAAGSNLAVVEFDMKPNIAGVTARWSALFPSNTTPFTGDWTGVLRTPKVKFTTLPAFATSEEIITCSAAGTAVTVKMGLHQILRS